MQDLNVKSSSIKTIIKGDLNNTRKLSMTFTKQVGQIILILMKMKTLPRPEKVASNGNGALDIFGVLGYWAVKIQKRQRVNSPLVPESPAPALFCKPGKP